MPRTSSAALAVLTPPRPRAHLQPSPGAPAEVKVVFAELVGAAPAGHFKATDAPLLEEYATAIVWARRAAEALERDGPLDAKGRPSGWLVIQEKSVRAIAALAMRLRLSPQHREQSRTAGRRANGPQPGVYDTFDVSSAKPIL
jgi:hypothetical protein